MAALVHEIAIHSLNHRSCTELLAWEAQLKRVRGYLERHDDLILVDPPKRNLSGLETSSAPLRRTGKLRLLELEQSERRGKILTSTAQERKELCYTPTFLCFLSLPASRVEAPVKEWLQWAKAHGLPTGPRDTQKWLAKATLDGWRAWAAANQVEVPADPSVFTRVTGHHRLDIQGSPRYGIMYGTYPRQLIDGFATYVTQLKNKGLDTRKIVLGQNFNQTMKKVLGVEYVTGNLALFQHQYWATVSSRIYWWQDVRKYANGGMPPPYDFVSYWKRSALWEANSEDPDAKRAPFDYGTTLTLGDQFHHDLLHHAPQMDLGCLRWLSKGGACLPPDLYRWLSYRANGLKRERRIKLEPLSWDLLKMQFGTSYAETKYFRREFLDALKRVQLVYPKMQWEEIADRSDKRLKRLHLTLKDTSVSGPFTGVGTGTTGPAGGELFPEAGIRRPGWQRKAYPSS
jgi:hypothetical protein